MARLDYNFSDLYNSVAKYLGTYGSSGPSGSDLTDAKDIVHAAYRRFINAREWSFLKPEYTLVTEANDWVYELPEDFADVVGSIQFDDDDNYEPLESRPVSWIREQRAVNDWSSYPEYYALRPVYDKEYGQRWEILFYPTPDAAYSLHFLMKIDPPKLSGDNDYPIGGSEYSGVLRQLCLAEAESGQEETSGTQEAKAGIMLADAINNDKKKKPHNLGHMGGGRRLSAWDISRGSILTNEITSMTSGEE